MPLVHEHPLSSVLYALQWHISAYMFSTLVCVLHVHMRWRNLIYFSIIWGRFNNFLPATTIKKAQTMPYCILHPLPWNQTTPCSGVKIWTEPQGSRHLHHTSHQPGKHNGMLVSSTHSYLLTCTFTFSSFLFTCISVPWDAEDDEGVAPCTHWFWSLENLIMKHI